MVKKVIFLLIPLILFADLVCSIQDQRIICTYFIDRSDNAHGLDVRFFWHSPDGKDDRIKIFHVPPYHGSVYDYRFLPGRQKGKWVVEVQEIDTNKSTKTSFEINESSEEFFED